LFALVMGAPALGLAEVEKEYYASGKLESEVNYSNGKPEGISREYYEDGKLKAEVNYRNGKREGVTPAMKAGIADKLWEIEDI